MICGYRIGTRLVMPRIKDITSLKFGRLVAIKRHAKDRHGGVIWKCICKCGNYTYGTCAILMSGHKRSCGCINRENIKQLSKLCITHDLSKSDEYHAWQEIKKRIFNKKCKAYKNYGGRGIRMCKRWLKFENFYKDMGSKPSKKHSLDRIDNDGDYEPNNCHWATRHEQANNTRRTIKIKFNGKFKTIRELAEAIDVSAKSLWQRLDRGMTIQDALTKSWRKKSSTWSRRS